MEKFQITGGKPLSGSIRVSGSKNAILPMLAATLLTEKTCTIKDVPDIIDVENFIQILRALGVEVVKNNNRLKITAKKLISSEPPSKLVGSMRGSVVLLGALLGRGGKANLAFPGGDLIGARPIDVHLKGFKKFGTQVSGFKKINLFSRSLHGANVLAESSVTGTENLLLASVKASGKTAIKLSAMEPHVVSLCQFLNDMGAKISGIGTTTLTVSGVKKMHGASSTVIPDMLEVGSFALLAAAAKSEVLITNVEHSYLDAFYAKMEEMGVNFQLKERSLLIKKPVSRYRSAVVRTGLYPNLATDLQPPFGVFSTQCAGKTVVHDWIWEGRFGYIEELKKMGANVKLIDAHQAEIIGQTPLKSGNLRSRDIRSGMTLLIAAIIARGKSIISDIHHIDRGYEKIEERLAGLGVNIQRISA